MLACSEGNAPDAARLVLDTVHLGFGDVHVEPQVEDDEAVSSALLGLYAGMLVSNVLMSDKRGAGEDVGVSFVGVTVRGGSLAHRPSWRCTAPVSPASDLEGVERLTDTVAARTTRRLALRFLPKKRAVEAVRGHLGPGRPSCRSSRAAHRALP